MSDENIEYWKKFLEYEQKKEFKIKPDWVRCSFCGNPFPKEKQDFKIKIEKEYFNIRKEASIRYIKTHISLLEQKEMK